MAALDAQAAQIHLQSAQEAERLAKERNNVLQLLQKVMLAALGQHTLPGPGGAPATRHRSSCLHCGCWSVQSVGCALGGDGDTTRAELPQQQPLLERILGLDVSPCRVGQVSAASQLGLVAV